MFLTDLSIKRPVVASVMSLVLIIFGLLTGNLIVLSIISGFKGLFKPSMFVMIIWVLLFLSLQY